LIKLASCLAGAALATLGTGGEFSIERLQRAFSQNQIITSSVVEVEPERSPSESLARIRDVLSPAVSDLATTFGVTRQSVYNWANGEPIADENAEKLRDLAQAADLLADAGIEVNASLLKRKFVNGRTLFQAVQAGESARDAALLLIQISKREAEQRDRLNARFANRPKTATTADFDLPASDDHG
jgi:transcriptional regulator with XRE-family HTH domain